MAMTTLESDVEGQSRVEPLGDWAALFRGLSDRNRLAILRHLALGEHRVVDLTAHLGLAQSTVSSHCACLAECGLIAARTQGRATVYALTRPQELDALLVAAEQLLAATGDAPARCATAARR